MADGPNDARKDDAGKLPLHLIDPLFLTYTARALAFGADKYGAWNWAKGTFAWGRVFAALLRHLYAFWRGESIDQESKLPHLAHACACLMFLVRYVHDGLGTDDRPVFPAGNWPPKTSE